MGLFSFYSRMKGETAGGNENKLGPKDQKRKPDSIEK